jgi:hypothetical protein
MIDAMIAGMIDLWTCIIGRENLFREKKILLIRFVLMAVE